MADSRSPLAVFDDRVFEDVADETGIPSPQLSQFARRHQTGIRELPGVDNIVYEWRNYFHMDPLVVRTEAAYVLAVESHVWDEFADRLELSGTELDSLKTIHDRQARTLAPNPDRFESADAIVLTRP
jgi:hypothetical protein